MFKITRQLIRDRQPHTAFAVAAVAARAWPETVPGWSSQDRAVHIIRSNDQLRLCWGWRVDPYDSAQDRVRVRPHWHVVSAAGDRFWHTDTEPAAESVLDQALAVYYRAALEGATGVDREPADLIWHQSQWWADTAGELHALPDLGRASIQAWPRSNSVVIACS